ncbi:flavin reductase family protein [Segnochrobactrum spirostomi]|uniref:flavin reductase family protein n=1 Tax=Segnochrobactrum spirostomi TaxID=2608987 RepID=UPI001FE74A79|nr:flavin reductase family protein [Segnochrobactrum spirostomi]
MSASASPESIDPRALRDAFGSFITGVTVVTAHDPDGRPIGFTANSFSSVSLDPPLLLVCLARSSRNYAAMTESAGFAVNILSEDQKDVSNTFARRVEDRFATVRWEPGPQGSPVFPDAAAWFDCVTERVVEAGDHAILIGRVAAFAASGRNGLGYSRGAYFTPSLEAQAVPAAAEGSARVAAVAERDGAVLLLEGDDGSLRLPEYAVSDGDPTGTLAAGLAAETGCAATVGFLFSIYADRPTGRQHVVYRATLDDAQAAGHLYPLDALPLDRIASAQAKDILRRYASERALGNFGIYVGNETAGRVHPLTESAQALSRGSSR